jgi:hypothetical protein
MSEPTAGRSGYGRTSIEWVPLDDEEHHVIARFTLEELASVVGASPESLLQARRRGAASTPLTLRPEEVETLAEIGGVATVTAPEGKTIVVARIGRTSLIAFTRPSDPGVEVNAVEVRIAPETES